MSKIHVDEARVVHILNVEDIGKYTKQQVVFQELDDYPQMFVVDFWNAAVEQVDKLKKGDCVRISFRKKSREYKGKWYTNLNGYNVGLIDPMADKPQEEEPSNSTQSSIIEPYDDSYEINDDIPF